MELAYPAMAWKKLYNASFSTLNNKKCDEQYSTYALTLVVEFGGKLSLYVFAMILCFLSYKLSLYIHSLKG